ncbi:hypothetical protein EDD52_13810 [Primorskyibacter sedentarius]|uniref:Uncharacterized protein n=1 Tax=Primorskyibacter sedentarius TaxID=745311 RepID=A0A4R3IPY9_9RHOB|nr:hypothetical protein EDD52_13810 [Primorskyibacter sedentarius]
METICTQLSLHERPGTENWWLAKLPAASTGHL